MRTKTSLIFFRVTKQTKQAYFSKFQMFKKNQ